MTRMGRAAALLLLAACLAVLAGCGGSKAVPLVREEIDRANEAFASTVETEGPDGPQASPSGISCFFTSRYDTPEDINLEEFLRYCPKGCTLTEEDGAEWDAVRPQSWFPDAETLKDCPVPVHRYRAADISALLEQYAGITAADLNSWAGTLYLEEYDAFYNFTSDFGPGAFICSGGEKQGGVIRLWSDAGPAAKERDVLTLREEGGRYLIQSFRREALEP